MEPFQDYLTFEGWKKDWNKTREDFELLLSYLRRELYFINQEMGKDIPAILLAYIGISLSTIGLAKDEKDFTSAGVLCCLSAAVDVIDRSYNKKNDQRGMENKLG